MQSVPERVVSRRSCLIAAGGVFAAAFVLYLLTLAPTVTLVDSGELILAAAKLGVAHPPGFPLYVMLAHLASLIPAGSVAVRIHVASAFFSALAAAAMTLLVTELMLTTPATKREKKTRAKPVTLQTKAAHVIGPAVVAGLLTAFSRTLWAYATIAEVYTLNSLMILIILWLMFAWRREYDRDRPSHRKLYLAALAFGLAMGVHHVTVAFFLPSLAVFVYATAGRKFFTSRTLLFSALVAVAGLSVYAYLPLAAARAPIMNWGEPTTLDAVWRHITGRQYQAFFSFDPANFLDLVRFLSREWGIVWLPAALVLAALGFVDRFRCDKVLFAFLAVVMCVNILYCLVYTISEDRDAYYLPTFIAVTIAAACGARLLVDLVRETPTSLVTATHAAVALLAVPIIALTSNLPYNNRRDFYVAHDYVQNMFASIEPGGMLLTSDWQPYAPSFYVRDIEGQRKDLIFIDLNLLRRSWYFAYLEKEYPDMISRVRNEVNAYLEDLRAWDRDPSRYERSPTLNQRINTRFHEMLQALVAQQLKTGPLYVTIDFADPSGSKDEGLMKALQERNEIVPQGLVFRVLEKGSTTVVLPPDITIRGLNDGTMKYESDDVVKKSVIPAYTRMLTNTGLYLVSKDREDLAKVKFQQALALDPTFELARSGLAAAQSGR